MSPLLRRLGVTRRRSRADLERALEVAETDRDIARAEKASAYEALGKVAAAAGRPGAPTRWNVEDLVETVAKLRREVARMDGALNLAAVDLNRLEGQRADAVEERDAAVAQRDEVLDHVANLPDFELIAEALAVADAPELPRQAKLVWACDVLARAIRALPTRLDTVEDQRDTLGAELVAVDEALAEAGAGPADDRAAVIRDLADRRAQDAREHFGQAADVLVETLGLTSCVRDGCGHARHQHAGAGECRGVLAGTRGAPCRCEAFDDGVVDARVVDARSLETGGGPVCGACGTPYPCPEHQPDALAAKRAAPTPLPTCRCYWCELVREQCRPVRPGVWCTADLDGAHCSRPAGHTEPCRPVEPSPVARSSLLPTGAELDAPEAARRWLINHSGLGPAQARSASSSALLRLVRDSAWLMSGDLDDLARVERTLTPVFPGVPVAQCSATGEPVAGRCERVAGHPGDHEWAAV